MTNAIDNLMTLADGLVQALEDGDFSIDFTASWQDDPILELNDSELPGPLVWVVDFAETYDTQNGVPMEGYELLLVFQRKLDLSKAAAQCREMSGLVSEVTRFCRNNMLDLNREGVACFKTERVRSRDFKAYNQDALYRAEVSTYWKTVSDDE